MEALDISDTLVARSDQLNADDLIGNPITVQITKVTRSETAEQPISIHISGGHRPWKPCKTMRRVLAHAWGKNGAEWVGKWLRLYRDDHVKFGGDEVGGIRIAAMSDIAGRLKLNLAVTKGKKAPHVVEVLTPPAEGAMAIGDFRQWLGWALKNGWSKDQVDALLGGKADDVPPEKRRAIATTLKAGPPKEGPPPGDDGYGNGEAPDEAEQAAMRASEAGGGW